MQKAGVIIHVHVATIFSLFEAIHKNEDATLFIDVLPDISNTPILGDIIKLLYCIACKFLPDMNGHKEIINNIINLTKLEDFNPITIINTLIEMLNTLPCRNELNKIIDGVLYNVAGIDVKSIEDNLQAQSELIRNFTTSTLYFVNKTVDIIPLVCSICSSFSNIKLFGGTVEDQAASTQYQDKITELANMSIGEIINYFTTTFNKNSSAFYTLLYVVVVLKILILLFKFNIALLELLKLIEIIILTVIVLLCNCSLQLIDILTRLKNIIPGSYKIVIDILLSVIDPSVKCTLL